MTDEKKKMVVKKIYSKFMDFLDDSTVKEFIEDDPDTSNPHATRNTVKGYELYSMIELILDLPMESQVLLAMFIIIIGKEMFK